LYSSYTLRETVSVTSKTSGSNKKYLLPKDLARIAGCSERTIREYCKRQKIPEAIRTRGGHFRIVRPLSGQTRLFLEKLRGGWPFDGSSDAEGEFEPDYAESLLLAHLYDLDLDEFVSDPVAVYRDPKKLDAAEKIEKAIFERQGKQKGFSNLILVGSVCRFWRRHKRAPTVQEIANAMRVSRSTFYRRYRRQDLNKAVFIASGEARRELQDHSGFDASQRTSWQAKKPGFSNLQRDVYAED
jgi:hypothetical protein